MWSCPNCEQNNMETAAYCTLCGTEKPAPEGAPAVNGAWGNVGDWGRAASKPDASAPIQARDPNLAQAGPTPDAPAKPRKKSHPILIAAAVVAAILLAVALNTSTNRQRAIEYLDAGDYDNAYTTLQKIWFTGLLPEEDGNYLYTAVYMVNQDYDEAYGLLRSLGRHRNSKALLTGLKGNIYGEAVSLYRNSEYRDPTLTEAANMFRKINPYDRSADYIALINAKTLVSESNGKALLNLIGFEDANAVILSNWTYAQLFLEGVWSDHDQDKHFVFERLEDGYTHASHNLPDYDWGVYFDIVDGYYQAVSEDSTEYIDEFKMKIISRDRIEVLAYVDGSVYILDRQY